MSKIVIFDCRAPWRAPCRKLTPALEQLAADYADTLRKAGHEIVLEKVNVDEEPLPDIQHVPTVSITVDGQLRTWIDHDVTPKKVRDALEVVIEETP